MKKLIYSLTFIVMALVGCTSFDDAVRENYGEGPSIAINVTNTTDSAFTFTVSPASGTQFYNFLIEQADEADPEVEADVLLRGGYGNKDNVTNATTEGTISKTYYAEPNTTYQIYAVAASDKGITGAVTVVSVTTSDQYAPALIDDPFEPLNDEKAVVVNFDQAIERGTGDVSAIYYKEWDWDHTVVVPSDEIVVEIEDNMAKFSAPNVPDGAILAFSWAAGAFTDAKGNRCASFTSVYDEDKDEFFGAVVECKKVAFEIPDTCFAATNSAFKKPEEFNIVINFPFDIFTIDEVKHAGDIKVIYENDDKSIVNNVKPDAWTVSGRQLKVSLPEGVAEGDKVLVQLEEGIIYDVYGNPNQKYEANDNVWWMYVTATVDDIVGTYTLKMISYYDESKTVFDASTVTIETTDKPNGLLLKNFWLEGYDVEATYNLATKILTIPTDQPIGVYTDEDGSYGLLFTNAAADADVEFTIDLDNGTMTCTGMWGIYAFDAAYEKEVGWFEVAAASMLAKNAAAVRKAGMTMNAGKLKKSANKIVRK